MSFVKIPFALNLTGWGCQRTLWSAATILLLVLEGFYSCKLQKILLIIAPKLSFQITPGLEIWGAHVLPSHCSVEQLSSEGSGSLDWHLIVTLAPSTDSLWSSSVPEKFPNKAEWLCQALLYIHTTRTLAGLFLRMGHHLGELRKQLIRAPGENPFLPGHCCAIE